METSEKIALKFVYFCSNTSLLLQRSTVEPPQARGRMQFYEVTQILRRRAVPMRHCQAYNFACQRTIAKNLDLGKYEITMIVFVVLIHHINPTFTFER